MVMVMVMVMADLNQNHRMIDLTKDLFSTVESAQLDRFQKP
jgi:hypothetical protein